MLASSVADARDGAVAVSRGGAHARDVLTQAESSAYALAEVTSGEDRAARSRRHAARASTSTDCRTCDSSSRARGSVWICAPVRDAGSRTRVTTRRTSASSPRRPGGVFDGNVQVNKKAQRTDAGQISEEPPPRPSATVERATESARLSRTTSCATHGCTAEGPRGGGALPIQSRGLAAQWRPDRCSSRGSGSRSCRR